MKQSVKEIGLYICVGLLVLVMSWEYQRAAQASVLAENQDIPEDAIRLRILAHSDRAQDQWLKEQVRDQLVQRLNESMQELEGIDEARELIQALLPELEQLVARTITGAGYAYPSSLEYGTIPFPAKLYGQKLYPAGEYEGLLVTIGEGQGSNWWCVLFPPLCFVDFGTSEAIEEGRSAEMEAALDDNMDQKIDDEKDGADKDNDNGDDGDDRVEVRFFILDLVDKIISWFTDERTDG